MAQPERQRVALVVFADVDGGLSDSWHVAQRALREKLGPMDGEVHTVKLGGHGIEIGVRFHDVMEVGMAAGNGYLWTEPTSKAFRQYAWQFEKRPCLECGKTVDTGADEHVMTSDGPIHQVCCSNE